MTEFLRTVSKSFETANDLRNFAVLFPISLPEVRIEVESTQRVFLKFLNETLVMVEFFPDGRLWSETFFKNNKRQGRHRQLYKDGGRLEENYIDGERHGLHRQWNIDGNPTYEAHYKNGLKDGLFTSWSDRGNVYAIGKYKNDIKDGIWCYYNAETQQKEEETEYRNGEVFTRYLSR